MSEITNDQDMFTILAQAKELDTEILDEDVPNPQGAETNLNWFESCDTCPLEGSEVKFVKNYCEYCQKQGKTCEVRHTVPDEVA